MGAISCRPTFGLSSPQRALLLVRYLGTLSWSFDRLWALIFQRWQPLHASPSLAARRHETAAAHSAFDQNAEVDPL